MYDFTLFDKVKSHKIFNTGRVYDFDQQIEAYEVGVGDFDSHVLAFYDKSRKLSGVITVFDMSPAEILRVYDAGGYDGVPMFDINQMVERYKSRNGL